MSNQGQVVSVRGSVVDVWFDDNLPPIYTLLHAGKDREISIEVLTQLEAHRVRGICTWMISHFAIFTNLMKSSFIGWLFKFINTRSIYSDDEIFTLESEFV